MYILAIVLMFVLPIDHGHSVSQNRNILDAYSDNVSWFECPRGWKKFGRKCLLPVTAQISWRYAETICKRFGSTLWVTDSYNYNKKVGEILRTLTSNLDSPDSNLPPLIWIGLMCNSSCSEMDWAGFWTPGQTFLFNQNVDSCAQLNIAETTAYGDYRWTLEDCFTQTWFVCQTDACISGQFHCLTDNKCISNYWVCDGKPDCPDGSDEINCAAPCYFKFTNSSGMFGSPNYPMNYEPFSYCQWLIQTPLGTKVQLQFESFDIEKYDFVEVRDGGNPAALLLGKYTGKAEFEVPLSSSSLLLVILKTDHSYQKQGFQAVWHAVKLQDCGATLTSSEEKQWLTSPRYPGFYPNSVVCDWIITSGNKNDIVTLQFTDFRLSQNDWLEVRDGNSSGSKLHKRLEGKNMPDVIISVGPSFFLRFFTDSAFRGKGFNMTYVSGCHIVVTNIPATFESPGRGRENYPNRINCSWHVQDEKKRNMTLVFDSKFDTEVDADIVQVYNSEDGKEESLLGSFSGTKVPPLLTSSTGQFKVTFVSDELLRKTGWNASVSFGFDCGFPGLPEHTSLVHITGTTAGAVAKYKCWTGYRADRLTSVCRNNVWDPLPICTMIVCEITSNITNGKVYYDTPSRYGSTIYYNCCYGFHPVGFTRATCLETGNWSSPPPICKENLCLSSVHVLNSNSTVKGPVLAGYSDNILCDPGYQLSNSTGRITCMTSGVYHISASCTDIDECENSSLNSCGIHMCENLPGKYICKCLKGYRHDSEEMRFCVDIDECLENNGKCEQKCTNLKGSYFCYCDDKYYLYNNTETGVIGKKLLIPKHSCINTCSPLHIANGKVFYSMQSFNNLYLSSTVAYVECPKGYVADGSTWTTCTSSGSWSFLVTHCTVAECLSVQPPQHGNVSYSNGLLYGSTASYTCTKGYILVGNRIRYCENAHGHGLNRSIVQWTGTKPSCEIAECGEPPPLTNGHVTHGKTVVNSWSSYSCMCGYKLVGSGYRTCQTSGLWSKNSIQCIPIYCPKPQKPFFGLIKNETQKKFPVGSTIHFLCDKPGFKLSGPPFLQCVFSKVPIHSKIIRYSLTLRTRFRTVTPASSMCLNLTSSQYRQMLEPLLTADIDTACNHSLYMELTLSERHPHLDSSQLDRSYFSQAEDFHPGWLTTIVLEMNITFLAANSQEKQLRICNCAENVVPTVMSKVQGYMELVTSLSCPAVDVQSVTMEKVQHLWQCPKGFTVPKIGLTCLDADPKCVQECPSVKELILAAPNLHINKAKVFSTPSSSHVFSDSSPGPMEFRGVFTTTMPGITLLQRRNYAIACLTYNLTIITSDAVLMKCSAEMQNLLSQRLVSMQENLKLLLPLLPYCNMKGLQMKLQLKHGIDPHHAALAFDIKLLLPLDAAGKKKLYNCSGELSKFVKINLGEDSSLDRRNLFICSNLRGLSTHLFQLNSNNRHQHIRKRETSHIAADSFPDAQWSEETPRCADVQDPVFHDCNNITINHSINGVEPTILAVPRVTDNSGEEPCVTSTPADLHLLVDVKKNTSVLFQAVDASGNKAFCHLNIFINDTVPPRIICPSAVVSIGYQSDRNVQITYKTVELIATDNVQIDYITFKPPNGTVIKADSFVQVMATAVDVSGNSASCYFTYKAYTSGCPHTLLATPENGTKSCTNMTNNNITEHRCRLYCNINHDIVQWHDQSYICYGNGDWNPKFPVLDCAMQQAPDYWMKVKLTFYRKDISNMFPCMSVFMKAIMANRNKFIINSCFNLTGQLAIITEFDKSFQFDKNKLFTVANVRIVVVAAMPVSLHHFKNCLSLIMETTNARNVTLQTDRCGEISLIPPIVKKNENFSCLAGKTMKGEYCLQCTPGSHANVTTGKCQVCPVGTFQDKSGQLSCIPCPNGTTTDSILSKNISQCLSTCQAGEFSDNGLIPCRKCPLGFFQSRRQSLQCLVCPVNMSTPEVGATSVNNCSVVCLPGTFSYTGVAPCFDCPLHTHAAGFGSISCTEHPGSAARSGRYQKPDCVGKHCKKDIYKSSDEQCGNNGTYLNLLSCFERNCSSGYDDHFCPAETDHCLSNSCVHGVCIEEEHSYSCECYTGFEGNRCEKDIDDCFHQPCQNKGVCIDLVGTFYCHCTGTGYEGNLCELDVDDCLQNICLNGGNCTDSINNFHCACPEDFTGTHCEKNIDECLSSPCLHDGLCLDQVNGYYCFCKPGYVGKNCEVGIDVCLPNPCLNNGKCLSIVTDFICHCNKGHTGKICETDIDDCNQFSCHFNNTLQCLDGVDSYKCLCKPGWTGVRCDTDINECLSNPCQYVNECRNLHNGFECGCLPGYTGLTCSVDIEECLSFPCQNNGTCIDKINDVECVCLPDFTGKHCEHYIDHCQRMKYACKNNSTCTNLGLNFECLCLPGWTGKYCAENVDECISIPCLNGGSCSDLLDSYECTCLKGFAGENCEQDTQHQYCNNNGNYTLNNEKHYCMCLEGFTGETCSELVDSCSSLNNICPNGTTCVIDSEGKFCMKDENEASMCPPMFEGYDCNKRSTDNYDLLLKAGSTCKLPEYNTANLNEFSVCFWVRVLGPQLSQTFLSLTGTGNESVDGSWKSREVVFEFQENQILISSFQKIVVPVNLSAGLWQQFCFLWSGTPLKPCIIMVDGNVTDSRTFGKRKLQLNSLQVFLEWKESQLQDTRIEISQFNMYSHMLSKTQVKHLAQNCTGKLAGDIVSWNQLKICQHAAVDVREPSACGNNSCPPGYTGMFCKTIIDVTPPEVLYCPENLKQISPENRLVVTKWVEPVFVDDRGVVEIKQTHRVGQIFSYGEYFISYVAYDANNNSASCSFMLYILPSDCMLPTATSNGELRCKEEKHGIFCKPRCADCMDFFQDVPAFYRCDQAGIWDPPLQNTFRSLPCAPVELPDHHVKGSLIFKSSDKNCSPERKAELKNSFVNFTHRMFAATSASNIKLVCSSSVYRKKRSTELNQFYKLSFNFLSNDSSSPDHFETALKKGRLNTFNFTAISKSLDVVTTLHCQAGLILTKTDKCVPCGAGTYYNLTSSKCEPCPVGMYNEDRKQFKCVHCKTGHTTDTIGAISKQDCYMMCLPGEAFNNESKKCELCPLGYYQDKVGELYCKSCPNGKTTLSVGAASLRNCSKNCPLGKELYVTNECIPCIKGTYRDQLEDSACKVCPFGYTTVEEGAVSLNQCSVVHCNSGYYRNHTSVCRPCPRGTYQPQRNKISCLRCMKGLTTLYPATKSIADCISGNINQCISGFHNCHEHANCMNINGDILCVCQDGFQGNGIVCEDICTNFCLRGSCMKVDGNPYCKCPKDYKGMLCENKIGPAMEVIIGGVVGGVILIIISFFFIFKCVYRKKHQQVTKSDIYHRTEIYNLSKGVYFPNKTFELPVNDVAHPIPEELPPPDDPRYWRTLEIAEVHA